MSQVDPPHESSLAAAGQRWAVVLATYNGERFVGQFLASLLRQGRMPYEMVVVDDGSIDRTPELVEEFVDRAEFPVKLVRHRPVDNRGPAASFYEGMRLCEADWIALADQDDLWCPDKLGRLERAAAGSPKAQLIFSDADLIGDSTGHLFDRLRLTQEHRQKLADPDPTIRLSALLSRPLVTGATMAVRRHLVADIPAPTHREALHDRWISLVAAVAGPLLVLDDRLIAYRLHGDSVVGLPASNWLQQIRRALTRPSRLEGEVAILDELISYLQALSPELVPASVLQLVQEQAALVRIRAKVAAGGPAAWSTALVAGVDGTYRRAPYGTMSLARDLAGAARLAPGPRLSVATGAHRPIGVVVDARPLEGAESFRGIGTFTRELLRALGESREATVYAACQVGTPVPEGIVKLPTLRVGPGRFSWREHDLLLPLDLTRGAARGAVVAHEPSIQPPRRSSLPLVQTVHDVIPLVDPDPGLDEARRIWERNRPRFKDAQVIVADSAFTASQLEATLGVDPERVRVVHLAAAKTFRPPAEDRHRPWCSEHPQFFEIPRDGSIDPVRLRPYVAYVGEYDPRKGYKEAFEVAAGLADLGLPHRLVVAGRIAPWVKGEVEYLLDQARRPERILLGGFVPDLPSLYQNADALIVTSRSEGFGLPALEAMSCGTPVVAFANSATAEVIGAGGRLVPDRDVPAMVAGLKDVLGSRSSWLAASDRAVKRASYFTWAKCAEGYLAAYRDAASAAQRESREGDHGRGAGLRVGGLRIGGLRVGGLRVGGLRVGASGASVAERTGGK
jgi:glycosyltransferase involved in cell wall biosynthesis